VMDTVRQVNTLLHGTSVFLLTDDHWEFVGHTIVTNNYVRLTADVRSSQGAIWNTAVSVLMS